MQFHLDGFVPGDPDIHPPAQSGARVNGPNGLPRQVDVLIAGCGPAGLCLAAQLARFPKISTMIVEPKSGPMEKGQADGISVRSMEMFQAFGFADKMKREAVWINETTFWQPDPENPDHIHRVGRVRDVEEGLSEMPHVLNNQARVHDMFLEVMRNAPTRLEPDYGLRVAACEVEAETEEESADGYPVRVTLERVGGRDEGRRETVRARYVVGCDGARSTVRGAIGGRLHGEAAHQAWGVMDILAVTGFPDYRMKSIIQSSGAGSLMVLPREGGNLVRVYVELDKLAETTRISDAGLTEADIIERANRILHPFRLDVKEVVWWSVYEIGQRLTDKFDDVPADATRTRAPRIFTAGDACHTHSPKAGQGMNVSMGDTFNLGWKLVSVLTGRAGPDLLHSYSQERRETARALIEYDQSWSTIVGAPPKSSDSGAETMPLVQRKFIEGGRFTAGLTVVYPPSALIGDGKWQALAPGFPIGARFHSAPVIRLADARPLHLGHVVEAGMRWTLFVFSPAEHGPVHSLCNWLEEDPASPLRRFRRSGEDIDALVDTRAVFQQGFREVAFETLPSLLRPAKGRLGLTDYEKAFCADRHAGKDIFEMRGIDRQNGGIVIVRPDQHVANVLPLDATDMLGAFFASIFLPSAEAG